MITLAWTIARRNLKGGRKRFLLAVFALALGVTTIAGVGSFGAGLVESLRENGRVILGGDIALRTTFTPPDEGQIRWLEVRGALSRAADLFAMARPPDGEPLLVNLRAVDDSWPLYGEALIDPPIQLGSALAEGAIVDRDFLESSGLAVGSSFSLGEATVPVVAALVDEPDRASAPFRLGPRVIVSLDRLDSAGIAGTGSLVRHLVRMRLDDSGDVTRVIADLKQTFPQATWRIRSADDANPSLRRFLERLSLFITLVGLTALLIGGIGMSSAVTTYLARQVPTIATLKSLGASQRLVLASYLVEIALMAGFGIAAGLVAGTFLPVLAAGLAGESLPVTISPDIHPGPLLIAAACGILITLVFALPPLFRTREISPAMLFRASGLPGTTMRQRDRLTVILLAAGVVTIAIVAGNERLFAALYCAVILAVLVLFRLVGQGISRLARSAGRPRPVALRLALANLHRPGAGTVPVSVALGTGLAVLAVIAGVEANLSRELDVASSREVPAFFVVDIQSDQIDPFIDTVTARHDVTAVESSPAMRGRVTAINGVPVAEATIDDGAMWSINSDVGVTYEGSPGNATVVAGQWWEEDHNGPPLLSFDAELAAGYHVGVGDTLTVNVLGREITARIANLRHIDWTSAGLNFVLVFSPGLLEAAPHTHIATLHADVDAENPLRRELARMFPNISIISVRHFVEDIRDMLESVDSVVRGIAFVAFASGLIVIAETVVAAQRRRLGEAVILKVLGATRPLVLGVFTLEHAILGTAVALPALAVGTAASWAIVTFALDLAWIMPWTATSGLLVLALGVSLIAGVVTGWSLLSAPAAPVLRNT